MLSNQLTLSEIAVQTLQEERWRGSSDQTQAFIRRLCVGRSETIVIMIAKIRDAFEYLDDADVKEVDCSNIYDIFKRSDILTTSIEMLVNKFIDKLKKQGRDKFTLPEVFEHFGSILQEMSDSTVTIPEAFALLRLNLPVPEVTSAAHVAMKIIDNILNHVNDSKYWQINIKSEVT